MKLQSTRMVYPYVAHSATRITGAPRGGEKNLTVRAPDSAYARLTVLKVRHNLKDD